MKTLALVVLILFLPAMCLGQARFLFSHQSVGRHVVAEPERADPILRAANPIRDFLNSNVALWDHDYYNFSTDLVTPGVYIPGSLLDPSGEIFSNSGFGAHRGSDHDDVLMSHLIGDAFTESPDTDGRTFRDSCMSRFDAVMMKPGYRDLHMNTVSSLNEYQQVLLDASDWWHDYNTSHGTSIFFVLMTSSSLRHPSDYSGGSASWENNSQGHAEAETDVAVYRELDLWLQNVWVNHHPENRYFSTFELCINLSGDPSEKYFTKDIYTGTGAGDSSGDHHLNAAGSEALQEAMVSFINQLADEIETQPTAAQSPELPGINLFSPCPNPFNPTTTISFELSEMLPIQLSIFDISGKRVITLVDETREAGRYEVFWNGKDVTGNVVSSGIYFARIESGTFMQNKSMTLIK